MIGVWVSTPGQTLLASGADGSWPILHGTDATRAIFVPALSQARHRGVRGSAAHPQHIAADRAPGCRHPETPAGWPAADGGIGSATRLANEAGKRCRHGGPRAWPS